MKKRGQKRGLWYRSRCHGYAQLFNEKYYGAATYGHHAFEAFRTLKATAAGKTPFKITDVDKLQWLCEQTGNPKQETNELAVQLAELLDRELKVILIRKALW